MATPLRTGRRPATRQYFASAWTNVYYLPALALFAVLLVYPLLKGVRLAFTDWDGLSPTYSFIGFDNFVNLWHDNSFRLVLRNTVIYGVGSTLVQQVLGLLLAVALNRRFRGRAAVRTIIYLPVLVSPVVMGTFYYLVFQYNNGALNTMVQALGGEPVPWLADEGRALLVIVLVNALQFVGVSMMIYLAGLQAIPPEVSEAAEIDGAGGFRQFFSVTLPLLQPAFATSVVLNLIGGLKLFDVIAILTGGGPGISTNSVSTYIGRTYFNAQAAGYSSAMGVVLFVLVAVVTLVVNAGLNRRRVQT